MALRSVVNQEVHFEIDFSDSELALLKSMLTHWITYARSLPNDFSEVGREAKLYENIFEQYPWDVSI